MPPFIADNLDYLLFALASAAVFFALGRVLRRRSAEARLPRATWWIVLAVLGLGWSFVDRAGRAERRKIEELVSAMGPTYATERNLLFAGGVVGGIRNGERGGLGGERGGGRVKFEGRRMKRAGRMAPDWPLRRLNGDAGGIHDEIPMALSMHFLTALPRHFWQRDVVLFRRVASSRGPQASGVFQDERAAVSEIDFRGFPGVPGALVPEFGRLGWGFVIVGWNPSADRLPGRFDGLEGLIRPPRPAGSPCGLRLRLRPKRLRSLGVFQCRKVARAVAGG